MARGKKAHKLRIKGVAGECIMRNDASTDQILDENHGTTIRLEVRPDVSFEDIAENLKSWIVIPQCIVEYKEDNSDPIKIGYKTEADALKSFLSSIGVSFDENIYRIKKNILMDLYFII